MVLRDAEEVFKGASALKMTKLLPMEEEAEAVKFGILEALSRGFNDIIIEGSHLLLLMLLTLSLEELSGGHMMLWVISSYFSTVYIVGRCNLFVEVQMMLRTNSFIGLPSEFIL